jgi:NADH-quinone oxidoreductase subunit N
MFLAIPVKIAIILVLMKVLQGVFFCMVWFWQPLFVISAVLSMVVGACALVLQSNLKKFWAYSTINHMGYILLGLSTDTFMGLRAVMIYLVGYVLMNLCFFVILVALSNDAMQQRILVINQFALLPRIRYSLVSFFFAVLVFSLIGVPPFLGFWGKYFVLMAASSAYTGNVLFIILFIALATTLITTAGYLKIWRNIYMEKGMAAHTVVAVQPIPIYNLRIAFRCVFLLCFGAIFAGIFVGPFYDFLDVFIWGFIEIVPFGEYTGNLE